MLFGVFVEADVAFHSMLPTEEITWQPWHGLRIGHGTEDGFICVWLDIGGEVIGARRTRAKTVKWLGKKPNMGQQLKLAMLLPEKYA